MDDLDLSTIKSVTFAARRGSCKDCDFSCLDGADLTCHFDPPQVTHVVVPVPPQAPPGGVVRPGQVQMPAIALQTYTSWPVIRPDQTCGKWMPKRKALQ